MLSGPAVDLDNFASGMATGGRITLRRAVTERNPGKLRLLE
jgi:hypothetical protein